MCKLHAQTATLHFVSCVEFNQHPRSRRRHAAPWLEPRATRNPKVKFAISVFTWSRADRLLARLFSTYHGKTTRHLTTAMPFGELRESNKEQGLEVMMQGQSRNHIIVHCRCHHKTMWVRKLVQFVLPNCDQAVAGVEKGSARGEGKPKPWRGIVRKVVHSRVSQRRKDASSRHHINVVVK